MARHKRKSTFKPEYPVVIGVTLLSACTPLLLYLSTADANTRYTAPTQVIERQAVPTPVAQQKNVENTQQQDKEDTLAETVQKVDWHQPTGGSYPDIAGKKLKVEVSLKDQRAYIKDANTGDTLYTMVVSTGINDSTPKGTFTIDGRGETFYNKDEQMGGNNWVNFKDNIYLFHTVPTDSENNYISSEADKLGIPASHGCVRLSIPDSEWFYKNISDGTKVTIE